MQVQLVDRCRPEEVERLRRVPEPGAQLLRLLGNKGQSVRDLLDKLHRLAKKHGPCMDRPQLLLHRKFRPVIWARDQEVIVSVAGDGKKLKLDCRASGFPTPSFQWLEEGKPIDGATANTLVILRWARLSGHAGAGPGT